MKDNPFRRPIPPVPSYQPPIHTHHHPQEECDHLWIAIGKERKIETTVQCIRCCVKRVMHNDAYAVAYERTRNVINGEKK